LGGSDLFEDVYGDLEITSGIDSIRQDLFNKMLTPYGSLAYHPEYGSNLLKIIGNRKDVNWSDKAVIEIRRVLKTDNRVQRVVDVAVENLREGAHIRCYLVAKGYEVPISLERLIPYQEG
jgi:phage baseplate assembly protein W